MPKSHDNHNHNNLVDTIVTPDQKVAHAARVQADEASHENVEDRTAKHDSKTDKHDPWLNVFKRGNTDTHSQEVPPTTSITKKKFTLTKWHKIGMGVGTFFLLLLVVAGVIGFRTYVVATGLKTQALEMKAQASVAKEQLKAQNLPATEATLIDIQSRLERMKGDYQKLSFYKAVPIASAYYKDGEHAFAAGEAGIRAGLKTVDALVPYADVLGFQGEGTFAGGTTEDRIKVLLETLSKITPVIDDISAELQTVDAELAQVNPNRYPEKIQGYELRSMIVSGQELTDSAIKGLTDYKPVLEVLPEIAGSDTRKKYLVIFQNDNELRPTGGFMTAYAVMFIEDGKVTPEKSDDIYELDKKFNKRLPIPEVLGRYLTSEKYFNLRDMNISPDFKASMDEFYSHYKEVPGEPDNIDGIISVDTNLLTELVRVLGPVEVPGYGTFSAENDPRCDCPQIIYVLSEIVDRPTPYLREDRKGIIAPMMQAILKKSYDAPNSIWPQLFELGMKKIEGRHVQFYFFDEKYQAAAETVRAAGRMDQPKEGQDYLAVVDANLGGAKSNLFVKTEGILEVSAPENGQLSNKLTLKYKNDRKGDNCNLEAGLLCLNGQLRDWVRIYLPKGAKLVNANGFDANTMRESEDETLGFHVVEGVIRVAPLGQANLQLEYTVPYADTENYKLLMRKQAGTDPWPYLLNINGHEEEVILNKDLEIEIPF